jgi:biopolymer transport protein ExbB
MSMTAGRFLGVVAALLAGGAAVLAQEAAPAAPAAVAAAAEQTMTIRQIIQAGGWLMYVIGAMSVAGLAMVIYFLAVLREEQVIPSRFITAVRTLLSEGRLVEAHAASRANASSVAAVITAALDYVTRTGKPDPALLREIVEGEGTRQASIIQNQTQYPLDIGVIAPMCGLLGTVIGMLQAFNTVALDLAKAKPMLLAAGVTKALVTTVAGLVVAIPAMMAYAYFRGRVNKLISSLEASSADVLTLIVGERKP